MSMLCGLSRDGVEKEKKPIHGKWRCFCIDEESAHFQKASQGLFTSGGRV